MLPINKKQLQNQDCYYLDIAVVFFFLVVAMAHRGVMVANMHAPMTRIAVIIITT